MASANLGVSAEARDELELAMARATSLAAWVGVPMAVLMADPPGLAYLPRLAHTVLLAAGAFIVLRVLRPRGPLLDDTENPSFWQRAWALVFPLFCLGLLALPVMDGMGYRIGAWMFTRVTLQILAAAVILAGIHALATRLVSKAAYAMLGRIQRKEGAAAAAAAAGGKPVPGKPVYEQFKALLAPMTRMVGTVVLAAGIVFFAWYTDLLSGLRQFASAIPLYRSPDPAGASLSLWNVVAAVAWLVAGHFVLYHMPSVYNLFLFPRLGHLEEASRYVILSLSRYAVLAVTYGAALLNLQVSPASLGWLMAALSVGIGFGLQEIIANFVSGVILLLERPLRVGDIVTIGDQKGTVRRINIRATVVENFERQSVIVPNKKLITENVINWTYADQILRRSLKLGVAYGSDLDRVTELLYEVLRGHPGVLKDLPPQVMFTGFGESALEVTLLFHTLIGEKRNTLSEVLDQIYRRFLEAGISIPFPQREVHIVSEPVRAPGAEPEPAETVAAAAPGGEEKPQDGGER